MDSRELIAQEDLRKKDDRSLALMSKTPGFLVLQSVAKNLEEINIKNMLSDIPQEMRLLRLGEISGYRKLLQQVISRSESESKPPSWTETKE